MLTKEIQGKSVIPSSDLLYHPAGHLVSGFVKQHLPILLLNHLSTQPNHRQALSTGFLEMDAALANSR